MWSITKQMMRKNLRMLIPAGIAILIGTAFIAATLLFSNAMGKSMRDQVTAQFGDSNYVIAVDGTSPDADQAYDTPYGKLGMDRIEAIDGVEAVRPDIQRSVTLSMGERNVSEAVIATASDATLLPVEVTEGAAPKPDATDEVAIPAKTAAEWGVHVGDTMRLLSQMSGGSTGGEGLDVRVVGFTADPSGAFSYYGGATIASDDVIAALSDVPSVDDLTVGSVYLLLDDGKADSALAAIRADLPKGFEVRSRAEMAQEIIEAMGNDSDITRNFLLAFGVLALVVAALVIANTFQVLIAQRRRTLALLRTIGATKRQLYASVLQEAFLLSAVASLLGVAAGIGLMAATSAAGLGVEGNSIHMPLVFTWQVVALPMLFGIAMTVLASMGAARMATGVAPLEALRPLELSNQRKSRIGRAVIGLLCLVGGTGLAVLALLINERKADMALLAGILGCAMAFLGAALTALFWMPWLMRGVGALAALCGPSAKLADANIQKNPRRVAATGTALLIGVTLISTLATGATDAKATMAKTLDTRYSVDVVVTAENIPASVQTQVAALKGVEHSITAPVASGHLTDADGKEIQATIIGVPDGQALCSVLNTDLGDVTLGEHDVVVQRYDPATGRQLNFSDTVDVTETTADDDGTTVDAGHADLHVEQRDFRSVTDGNAAAFVNQELFENGTFQAESAMMLLKVDTASATLSQTVDGLTKAFEAYPGVNLGGPILERQQWESMVNMMLTLLVALLAVAVIIAVIGVANTLSLSVIERTRESATLRAIGMTRGQLRASLCIEALVIATVSSVVGMVLGTLFGWVGITLVMTQIGEVVYAIDWTTYGIILLLSIACALLASVFPARRAVRTPPVEALAES
ncbi:ABC transporter permease [Bifidobacterium cuniculi]|uniref:Transporter n=1 Tax=Bifidobacterium cuniculi TaxID=1688 RepID=A0A087B3V6_9BIFI|nr:FtsX-like permease family protein [Bifidobacterium cuniculi]KFI65706.1 transporter [Bifidobacterium cuniculi]